MIRPSAAVAAMAMATAMALTGCLAEEDPCACQSPASDTASPSAKTPR